jgi:hypothetical protein
VVLVGVVYAAPITIIDDAGPDDEPGQKDLNQLTVDFAPANGHDLDVAWNWDVIQVSGGNTGDACSLYDTDNDGYANYSLCVIWDNGASYLTTRLYSCGDDRADRCSQPTELLAEDTDGDGDLDELIGGPYASTCSLSTVADTFGPRDQAQADTTSDTQATCHIELDDFGAADAFLINVCSYPSQEPNSDPSDCVVTPNSGFLTIVKDAGDDTSTTFTFNLGSGQQSNDGRSSFTITGSGSEPLIPFVAGTDYDLTEVIPGGWQLDNVVCYYNGTPTGTRSDSTVTDFEIKPGMLTTCTFEDSLQQATLIVRKVLINDNGGTLNETNFQFSVNSGMPISFEADGQNDLTVDSGTYTVVETAVAGYTTTYENCTNVYIPPGGSATCTITNDDQQAYVTVVKNVINDNGGSAAPDDFLLTLDGNSVTSGVAVPVNPGTYTAGETLLSGYTFEGFSDDCNESGEVTVALGQSKTCTLTNNDVQPKLIVIKHVVNNFDEPADPSDFTMFVSGNNPSPDSFPGEEDPGTMVMLDAGPYNVTESFVDGYEASYSADCTGSILVGEEKTCTVTNTRVLHPGTIGFWKNWDNHYTEGQFNRLIDYLKEYNWKVYNRTDNPRDDLTIAKVGVIFDFGKKTPRDQMILAQLTAVKLNLAVTQRDGTDGIVQKNDDICLDTVVDVSGIRGARRFFGTSTPTIEQVVNTVEARWAGQLRIERKYWKFRLSKAEQNIVIKTLTGINEGDIITSAGCVEH